jgi:hypothetical protein
LGKIPEILSCIAFEKLSTILTIKYGLNNAGYTSLKINKANSIILSSFKK